MEKIAFLTAWIQMWMQQEESWRSILEEHWFWDLQQKDIAEGLEHIPQERSEERISLELSENQRESMQKYQRLTWWQNREAEREAMKTENGMPMGFVMEQGMSEQDSRRKADSFLEGRGIPDAQRGAEQHTGMANRMTWQAWENTGIQPLVREKQEGISDFWFVGGDAGTEFANAMHQWQNGMGQSLGGQSVSIEIGQVKETADVDKIIAALTAKLREAHMISAKKAKEGASW